MKRSSLACYTSSAYLKCFISCFANDRNHQAESERPIAADTSQIYGRNADIADIFRQIDIFSSLHHVAMDSQHSQVGTLCWIENQLLLIQRVGNRKIYDYKNQIMLSSLLTTAFFTA